MREFQPSFKNCYVDLIAKKISKLNRTSLGCLLVLFNFFYINETKCVIFYGLLEDTILKVWPKFLVLTYAEKNPYNVFYCLNRKKRIFAYRSIRLQNFIITKNPKKSHIFFGKKIILMLIDRTLILFSLELDCFCHSRLHEFFLNPFELATRLITQ